MCVNDNAHFDKTNGQDLIFWKSQSLFACMVRDIEANRDKDTEYGMVLYPKYDETQEKYLTLVDGHASMKLVPVFASSDDLEFIETITEALSAEAYNSVLPAYYETAMQIKFARDENFPEMPELIRLGRTFNFGYVYDIKINRDILPNLIFAKSTDLASKLAAAKDATNAYYEKHYRFTADHNIFNKRSNDYEPYHEGTFNPRTHRIVYSLHLRDLSYRK